MTQAQFARWLGVCIKQVKYLEHQRRNPSGPTRRLLGILADQLGFGSATPVQVLGAGKAELSLTPRDSRREEAPSGPQGDGDTVAVPAATYAPEIPETDTERLVPAPDDDAFVWR